MKHKTWFRLALKIVGIYLLALSIPTIVNAAATVVVGGMGLSFWGANVPGFDLEVMIAVAVQYGFLGSVLQFVIGLYLLLGAGLLTNMIIPSGRPYCPDCGHDLRELGGVSCPECGTRLPNDLLPPPEPPASEQPTSGIDTSPLAPPPMMRRIIPLGNRKALLAYYVAVASLLPVLGMVLGPIALAYGVEGIKHATRQPRDGGRAHGWVAVILGSATTLLNGVGLCLWPALLLR